MPFTLANDSACDQKRTAASSAVRPKTHTPGSPLQKPGLRFYNPGIGRWLSRDLIGERGSSLYGFVGNNPCTYIDLLGLIIKVHCPEEYFNSLDIPAGFSIQTSPDVYAGVLVPTVFTGEKEIVFKMLQSSRLFTVKNLSVAELKKHVATRSRMIALARQFVQNASSLFRLRQEGESPSFNATFWQDVVTIKTGVSFAEAINDVWNTSDSFQYATGCGGGKNYVFAKAILDVVGASEFNASYSANLVTSLYTYHGGMVKTDSTTDERDWVPGSYGHITKPGATTGLLGGEWILYLGSDDYWGLGGSVRSLSGWKSEVASWPGGAGSTVDATREYPKVGLQ